MVKSILIHVEDQEYDLLLKRKGTMSWRDFVLKDKDPEMPTE